MRKYRQRTALPVIMFGLFMLILVISCQQTEKAGMAQNEIDSNLAVPSESVQSESVPEIEVPEEESSFLDNSDEAFDEQMEGRISQPVESENVESDNLETEEIPED